MGLYMLRMLMLLFFASAGAVISLAQWGEPYALTGAGGGFVVGGLVWVVESYLRRIPLRAYRDGILRR